MIRSVDLRRGVAGGPPGGQRAERERSVGAGKVNAMAHASLRFWQDRFIWTSAGRVWRRSDCRPAFVLLIGGWGELSVGTAGQTCTGRAIVIGPQLPHSVHADKGIYSLNLDPVHPACRRARRDTRYGGPVWDVSACLPASILEDVRAAIAHPMDAHRAHALSEAVLRSVFPDEDAAAKGRELDPRITSVTRWLRAHLPERLSLKELAATWDVSPGHLSHLFKREMGVPIKSYLLAMRMRKAAEHFGAGQSLTEIAHQMGFADSSHMTKAFQAYFSIPPSLLANRNRVALEVCEPI